MIDADKVVQLALKSGARMVYVWAEPTRVENMNIMLYTKLLLEEIKNEVDSSADPRGGLGRDSDTAPATGLPPVEGQDATPDVQLQRKGRKKNAKTDTEGVLDAF